MDIGGKSVGGKVFMATSIQENGLLLQAFLALMHILPPVFPHFTKISFNSLFFRVMGEGLPLINTPEGAVISYKQAPKTGVSIYTDSVLGQTNFGPIGAGGGAKTGAVALPLSTFTVKGHAAGPLLSKTR
jgi:hypothetical protein